MLITPCLGIIDFLFQYLQAIILVHLVSRVVGQLEIINSTVTHHVMTQVRLCHINCIIPFKKNYLSI